MIENFTGSPPADINLMYYDLLRLQYRKHFCVESFEITAIGLERYVILPF
jgi:hypothetical protein